MNLKLKIPSPELMEQIYPELVKKHGANLPDPEHEPVQFLNAVRIYLYYDYNERFPDRCDNAQE
jgi:hypothetical protein